VASTDTTGYGAIAVALHSNGYGSLVAVALVDVHPASMQTRACWAEVRKLTGIGGIEGEGDPETSKPIFPMLFWRITGTISSLCDRGNFQPPANALSPNHIWGVFFSMGVRTTSLLIYQFNGKNPFYTFPLLPVTDFPSGFFPP
jgi:hypothetical protein